jgi:hypothetical protein
MHASALRSLVPVSNTKSIIIRKNQKHQINNRSSPVTRGNLGKRALVLSQKE